MNTSVNLRTALSLPKTLKKILNIIETTVNELDDSVNLLETLASLYTGQ